jgi:very-short-patch-repair endonuclease
VSWRDGLVNLTASNRLLNFKPRKTSAVRILAPGSAEITRGLNSKTDFIFLPPVGPESNDEDGGTEVHAGPGGSGGSRRRRAMCGLNTELPRSELANALRNLLRRSNQDFLDRGLWVLYLAVGTLTWDDETGSRFSSPLVLLPVELVSLGRNQLPYLRAAEQDPVVNPALALRLGQSGVALPTIDELEGADPDDVLAKFRVAVPSEKRWTVEDSVVLSYFTFAKEAMYRDLLENESLIADHPAIAALAAGGRGSEVGDFHFEPIPDSETDLRAAATGTPLVLDADSSQRACVAAAVEGKSFVMDGPPGTGKSQTIANMIGALLHAGKTVLFVSEKAAALDVVRNRLANVGLGAYMLELHSHKATRKQVADALGEALDNRPVPSPALSALNLDQVRCRQDELNRYAKSMNVKRTPLEESLHVVLGWISRLNDVPAAPMAGIGPVSLTVGELAEVRRTAEALARAWRPAEQGRSFIWRGVTERRSMEARLYSAVQALERLRSTTNANPDLVEAFDLRSPAQAPTLDALLAQRAARPAGVPDEWLTVDDFETVQALVHRMTGVLAQLSERRAELTRQAGVPWSSVPLPTDIQAPDLAGHSKREPPSVEVDHLTATRALSLADRLVADIAMLEKRRGSLVRIATSLAMPAPDSFGEAENLLALARVALEEDRPERAWLTGGITVAGRARTELEATSSRLAEAESKGASYYQSSLLDHDVTALHQRFTGEHRGLRKLGAAYRLDKKEVATFARPDVRRQETLAKLDLAVSWKDAADEYEAAQSRHAPMLGAYYSGRSTDYQRVSRALTLADEVMRRCGDDHIADVAARIAQDATPDPQLAAEVSDTETDLGRWRAGLAPEPAAAARPALLTSTVNQAIDWLRANVDVLRAVAGLSKTVSAAVGKELVFNEAQRLLVLRAEVEKASAALAQATPDFRDGCGELYRGERTSTTEIEFATGWARRTRSVATGADRALEHGQVAALQDSEPLDALRVAIDRWKAARRAVLESFDAGRRPQMSEDLDDYDDAAGLLEELRGDTAGQDEWFSYEEGRAKLDNFGLVGAVEFCIAERISADIVPSVLEKALLKEWADHQIATDPDLAIVRAEDRDALVAEYRALDHRLIAAAVGDILRECNARRPRVNIGQSAIIRREADKKRRHMPVRQLLERTSSVVQTIKPCFMMSPLAVSQYLPPHLTFDVVIFDEASQVAPQDAINCIYRGRALVTAGDQKQLPPTNFFAGVDDDGDEWTEESDDAQDFESILDLAKGSGAYQSLTLRWHYRSRHENLIAFSNSSFYRGKLITFPGAEHEGPDVGVELIPANGVYRRGTSRDNPVEAAKVVERVLHHFSSRPTRSLGVVTFSESQAAMIESTLEVARRDRPDLDRFFTADRLDGFFVKNLEAVQGDERDVMIFSLGYGPDEHGKFTLQLGPVTRPGGWRRLNVAVTRARFRNEIVASIGAADISETSASEGVRHLRRYLDFAERGIAALALDVSEGGDAESPFEESVIAAVRSWGYDVVPQVGAAGYRIDFGVHHPDHAGVFMLGVECDGFQYHSSKTARDRDRLREQVLRGLGWRLHRIWGTSWYRNRNGEEIRLRRSLEEASLAPIRGLLGGGPGEQESVGLRPVIEVEAVVLDEAPRWAAPYRTADPGQLPYWVDVSDPSSRYQLRGPLTDIVEIEGPVHIGVIHQRVRAAWGIGQVGSRIRSNINAAIKASNLVREGDFVRTASEATVLVRTPTDECTRSIAQVSDAELSLALLNFVRDAGGIVENDLTVAAARLFGWNRRGPDIAPRLSRLIGSLLGQGLLVLTDGELNVGSGTAQFLLGQSRDDPN